MKSTFIYFDDYCYLCSNTIGLLNVLDRKKKLKFFGLNAEDSNALLQEVPSHILNTDSIIVFYDDHFYAKSEALFKILESMGGAYRFFLIFKIIPPKYLDKVYDLVARARYRLFGRRKTCYLPKN